MTYQTLQCELNQGVGLIWLNRPDLRNAMNDVMLGELTHALDNAISDDEVRVILLAGRGKAFCAGGDLAWMKKARAMSPDEARADSGRLAGVLRLLHRSPKPTVARVHGAAFAGGMGLVAACDIAIASADTRFCLSEVKLGLIPAMISPYVIKAIGERQARRYFLSAEVFEAAEAWRIGLVQSIVPEDELDGAVNGMLGQLLAAGPQAMGHCKQLIADVAGVLAVGQHLVSQRTGHGLEFAEERVLAEVAAVLGIRKVSGVVELLGLEDTNGDSEPLRHVQGFLQFAARQAG
ncbi:MAG: enoyl-CoA hydratase/isomerase family protein, partial [Betaproteobacteria bacterium]|nr:enoyl-CoA hydratase/isomerase family protein [Betaproteobacteria bacterium]